MECFGNCRVQHHNWRRLRHRAGDTAGTGGDHLLVARTVNRVEKVGFHIFGNHDLQKGIGGERSRWSGDARNGAGKYPIHGVRSTAGGKPCAVKAVRIRIKTDRPHTRSTVPRGPGSEAHPGHRRAHCHHQHIRSARATSCIRRSLGRLAMKPQVRQVNRESHHCQQKYRQHQQQRDHNLAGFRAAV